MGDRITTRVDPRLVEALDRFIAASATPLRTKQEAVRLIVEQWLAAEGYLSPEESPPQPRGPHQVF